MKHFLKPNHLPAMALVCGAVGLVLHQLLYWLAVDAKGLLRPGHPVEIILWLLTAAMAGLVLAWVQGLGGEGGYAANFPKSKLAAAGHAVLAVCALVTVLTQPCAMDGTIALVWKWLGLLAFLMLLWAGYSRMEGKTPNFVTHLAVCAFLTIHIVTHYRLWSGDPQLLDYVFTLLGSVALLLFAYCQTAFDVGFCNRRLLLTMGLLAIYLILVGLPDTRYWLLQLGSIAWVGSNFCAWEIPEEGAQG